MKIIDKVTPIKTFGELERGEVFKGGSTGNVYIKVSHCYSDTDIEDFLDYEGSMYSIDELADALANGKLEEAWGCGTAAVVSPIGELCYKGIKYAVNNGEIGEVTQMLYDTLTGIQWGKLSDTFGWTYPIK